MATNQVQGILDARASGSRADELAAYDKYVESMEASKQTPKDLKDIK